MKAIVYTQYGPPEVLKIKEVAKPVPMDNEVLIQVYASTVGATDPIDRLGEPFIARMATGLLKPKHPVLGNYLAGQIEAVGKDVQEFSKGDRVFAATGLTYGAHAEFKCMPAEGALALIPSDLPYAEAAAIADGALTALPFLRDVANIQPGQKVLINGASGSVGSAAIQLAAYFGAEVTGVCSTANIEMVKALGADEVIDYTMVDFAQNGQTYDIIFDAIGKRSFPECKNALKPTGIYLTTVPTLAIVPQMLWTSKTSGKKARFAAAGLRPVSDKRQDLDFLKSLVEKGEFKPVIDRQYSMEQIVSAHRYVETGRKKGNVVIKVQ